MRIFNSCIISGKASKVFKTGIFSTIILLLIFGFRNELHGQSLDTIVSVKNLNNLSDTASIGDVIAISIKKTKRSDSLFTHLYLNGIMTVGLKPWRKISCGADSNLVVYFKLDEPVKVLLDSFSNNQSDIHRIIPVEIALGDKFLCQTRPQGLVVQFNQQINKFWIWFLAIIICGLSFFALYHNILKDDYNLYYSLSRSQLFYWTLLFVICYLYICLHTAALPLLTPSILAILGISAGTTAMGSVIENNRKKKNLTPIDPTAKSEGWFLDILSDGSSINIQRFQNVIFNLVFGIIFIQRTLANGTLPDFDDNILLLMGISSVTYAGLKTTEMQKEQQKQPEAAEPVKEAPKNENKPAAANEEEDAS